MAIVSFYKVQERSRRIIRLFLAGLVLYWTAGSLLFVQAMILIGSLFGREAAWLDLGDVLLILPFSIGIALVHYALAISGIVERTLAIFNAQEPDHDDPYHRIFENTIEEISVASGKRIAFRPVVIPCASLNGLSLRTPRREAVVGITEGLLARGRRDEIVAVAAQLAGQVLTCDALASTLAFSLFGSLEEMVDQAIDRSTQAAQMAGRASAFPGFLVLLLFLAKCFLRVGHFLNLFLSRERVFRSDAVAVELTRDPVGLALALRRLRTAWRGSGTFGDGAEAVLFAPLGRGKHDEEMGFLSFLFRCHPPLEDRLRRVLDMAGRSFEDIEKIAASPTPPRAVLGVAASPEGEGEAGRSAGDGGAVPATGSEESWHVYREGSWQGPFGLEALRNMDWLGPMDLVHPKGTRSAWPACQDPVLREKALSRSEGGGSCPRCGGKVGEIRYEGVGIRRCRACGGMLVGEDGIHRILVRRVFPVSEELRTAMRNWRKANVGRPLRSRRKQADIPDRLRCPLCGDLMFRKFYSAEYFLEVDHCFRCRATWYDGGELELLQALIEDARDRLGA
jgi:Zn-dependent protease with chaperone function/Zn-finger nucleic acid-binding protein